MSSRDEAAAVRASGGVVEADIAGRVLAARVPPDQVGALAAVPGVQILYPSERLHFMLDRSVPEIRATEAWNLTNGAGVPEQGKGALVGFVDSGIDYHNRDFTNPDGTTRIEAIWDQTQTGRPPPGYDFGTECDRPSIENGSCPEKDTDGHGTHVAGIAAGNGLSGGAPREVGVAPQAGLLVVKTDLKLDHVLAAWKYLIGKAQQLHEPIVINNSFGGAMSPHDGSAPDSQAVNLLTGPGHVFVAAAGNEGDQGLHASGRLSPNAPADVSFHTQGQSDRLALGVFCTRDNMVDARLTSSSAGDSFYVTNGSSIQDRTSSDGSYSVSMESDRWDDQTSILYITIKATHGTFEGSFHLSLQAMHLGANPRFDAWFDDDQAASFDTPDETDTINDPADASGMIAVGNYATRVTWTDHGGQTHAICSFVPCRAGTLQVGDIAAFSSVGPTADGRPKPDVSAPGTMIVSSLSRDVTMCTDSGDGGDCVSSKLLSEDGAHLVLTGTSMAAPHVAGVVALMLEADPDLDQQAATTILTSTARRDQFTGPGWTSAFGAGKMNAVAAVQAALKLGPSAVPTPSAPAPSPTVLPTALPPTPTSTPTPAFQLLSIRADRKATGDGWRSIRGSGALRAGAPVDLSLYTRFVSLDPGVRVTVSWSVNRGTASVFSRSSTSIRHALNGSVAWDHRRFTPSLPGSYIFTGTVAVAGLEQTRSLSFKVGSRP